MADIYKHSLLFRYNPTAADAARTAAIPGGWSESIWYPNQLTPGARGASGASVWAQARARFLSDDCVVAGFRSTHYTINGRFLVPTGTQVGTLNTGGKGAGTSGMPQDTLELRCRTANGNNGMAIKLAAMPDADVTADTYNPGDQDFNQLNGYIQFLMNGLGNTAIYWLGRDTSQPTARVLSYTFAGAPPVVTLTLGGPIGIAVGGYVRLHRVIDDNGNPIKGSFQVSAIDNTGLPIVKLTLIGAPQQTRSTPSGTARLDVIAVSPIGSINIGRMISRKVGRPTTLWRGRRSRQRI